MRGKELLVWWGDTLLDVRHGKSVTSPWESYDEVQLVLRPTSLEAASPRPLMFLALVAASVSSVAAMGLGAWLQRTDAQALHTRATRASASETEALPTSPLPAWVPPELCVPPPSPSDQDDVRAPTEHDRTAKHVAYVPRGARGGSEGSDPRPQDARSPQARTIVQVLESLDWQRPVSAYRDALESRAGDAWWSAGAQPGDHRIRIRGRGRGGGGRGVGLITQGREIGVSARGRRGCTSMICRERRTGRAAHVRLGRPSVVGALDEAYVRRVAARHRAPLGRCYGQALLRDNTYEGRMTVHAFVSPHGNVRSAIVAHSTIDDDELSACFVDAIQQWMFSQPQDGGMVSISFPFDLYIGAWPFR